MEENDETIKVLEFYSGIGGMHYALKASGVKFEVVGAFDINTNSNAVYKHNFPEVKLLQKNLEGLTVKDLEKWSAQCWTMSPPCQPYTRQGKQEASKDARSRSFLRILDLLTEMMSPPKYLLIENVKGFDQSDTRQRLVDVLAAKGYHFKEYLVTPSDFGIPNSRLRYYMLAKLSSLDFVQNATFPSENWTRVYEKRCISEYLEHDNKEEYSIPENILLRFNGILDIVHSDSIQSCCFTKAYGKYVEGTGSVFSNVDKATVAKVYGDLTSDKSEIEKLALLNQLQLRYFSPKEISVILCFPADFEFPVGMTTRQKYQLLGNSVNVHVISFLMKEFLFS